MLPRLHRRAYTQAKSDFIRAIEKQSISADARLHEEATRQRGSMHDGAEAADVPLNDVTFAVPSAPLIAGSKTSRTYRPRAELAAGMVCLRHDVAMLVRAGSRDDLPAMARVFRRAALSNEGDRDFLSERPELTVLEPPAEDDLVLVAEVTDRLVGFATARALGDDAFTVTDLFVDPDHMRSGIGRALIDAVVAASTGWERTRIEVEANPHSVAFYGRLGFVAVQEVQLEFGTALRMVMSLPVPELMSRGDP